MCTMDLYGRHISPKKAKDAPKLKLDTEVKMKHFDTRYPNRYSESTVIYCTR